MKEIEIISKRGKREKHFLQEDGTFIAKMYDQDIHFNKNGKYEEIDNTLILNDDLYVNKNNLYKVSFPAEISSNILKIEKDSHYIEFEIDRYDKYKIEHINTDSKLISSVIYKNILKNIDIQYDIKSTNLKETIILLNKNNDIDKLCFNIKTDLDLKIDSNDNILAMFKNEEIFRFDSPYMIDSEGTINKKVSYYLIKEEDKYQLFLNLDKEWLESFAKYPVMIDPTITNRTDKSSVIDTFINQNSSSVNMGSLDYLKVGVEKVNNLDVINRALLKFDLPAISTGSQVVNAQLTLYNYPYITNEVLNEIIDIHRITKSWNETDANWDNMNNEYDSRVEGTFEFHGWYHLDENGVPTVMAESADITPLVQKWYTTTPNYGILLKLSDEKYNMNIIPKFFSNNNNVTNADPKPILSISYRNQNGLENYMNYESHSLGKGKVYHNTYNGNMTAVFDIASTGTGKMPVNLKLVYNTNDVVLNKNIGYGIGYKFNLNQTISEVPIDDKVYLEYDDEDGTLHYFLNEKKTIEGGEFVTNTFGNIFFDEDGLDLKIEKYDDKYLLKDKNNNEMTFTKYNGKGYLTEIKDVSGNTNNIYYNSDYSKIMYISDANNQSIDIIYDSVITVISPSQTVTLSLLDQNLLNSIVYLDDTIFMNHNDKYLINSLSNISGKKIEYEYYDKSPYRLKKVTEYGIDNTLGNYYSISYGFNTTSIVDHKNKIKTITYNSFGNPESITYMESPNGITDAYGLKSTYGQTYFGVDYFKNKILSSQIPIKYVKNLLTNSSFEDDTTDFSTNELGLSYLSDEFAHSGLKSLRFETLYNLESKVSKEVNVEKGKYYTFSAYVRTSRWLTPVKLSLYYENAEGTLTKVESDAITSDDDFERLDVTIFYPEDAIGNLSLAIGMESRGLCFIDDVQLEEGEVVNNYNLIENSDFSNGFNDWDLTTGENYNTNDIFQIVNVGNQKALKVNMNTSNGSSIEKTFNIKGNIEDFFTLSFWYKNTGLVGTPLFEEGPKNVVSITFYPENTEYGGDLIENYVLNPNEEEWQFFVCSFVPDYNFRSFKLSFDQGLNGNEFYITNISLFKDVRSVIYNYDDNGNLISSKNLNNKNKSFNYDKNNELVKMTNPKGSNFTFEYDNLVTDRVLRGISGSGISNEMIYDNFGNPVISRITSIGNVKDISNGLYKIRLKGTKKLLRLINNSVSLSDDIHGHNKWNVEKVTIDEKDYYKIYHSIINNKYLTDNNNYLTLSIYQDDSSLFELIKQDNGSFHIKNKQSDKYIKNENNYLVLTDIVEDDENFEFYFEFSNGLFIENSTEYTEDGRYITKTIDTNFNEVIYDIDNITGLTRALTNAKNQTTYYNYDSLKRLESIETNGRIINLKYNTNNTLSKIIQSNRIYNFIYDKFLNIKSIKIGDNITLITNEYDDNNGNLCSITYGNNQTVNYEYDNFDRIKRIIKQDDIYNYKYNNNGDLSKVISNDGEIKYTYDLSKRLYKYSFNNFKITYNYDDNNNVVEKEYQFNNNKYTITNTLNDDDAVTMFTFESNEFNYVYDELGRLTSSNINGNNVIDYKYITNGKRTSMIIKSIFNDNDKYSYKYDKLGNISHIYHNDELENKYYYDQYNELIKEDNYILNKTFKYIYDELGNIVYKKEYEINTDNQLNQIKYEYNNQNWKDQLTKYCDDIITYDNLGNPLTIGNNITLTWKNGRQLNSYTDSNNNISYKYNVDGIRTSKILNNVKTDYFLENNIIIFEKTGENMLYYIRSSIDGLVGFKYNSDIYYYIKNKQDDIIGILDSNYNMVAKYNYDSFGNIISIKDGNGNDILENDVHIANINPYRYRSYYYDKETKLYYLNSRYYNPKWGRFINADNYISTDSGLLGYNMYAYCNNNGINYKDLDGHAVFAGLIIGMAVVGVAVIANSISRMKKAKKEIQKVQSKKNIPNKTKEIDAALKNNAEKIQNYIYPNQTANVKLQNFINNVKEYGPMDLKNKEEFKETISYNGIIMEPQDIGNFNFGYIGRAYGYPTEFLTFGAGIYQLLQHYKNPETYLNCFSPSLCDDPRDSYFIRMGAIKYDEEHKK